VCSYTIFQESSDSPTSSFQGRRYDRRELGKLGWEIGSVGVSIVILTIP